MSTLDSPFGTPRPVYQLPAGDRRYRRFFWRIGHLDLDYPTGVIQGLHYPFATDIDKLMTPLTSLLLEQLPRLEWSEQVRWMRICGLDAVTLVGAEDRPGLRRIETVNRYGVPTSLYAVEDPLPPVWWPESVETVPSQLDTLRRVGRLGDLRRVA